MDTETEKNLNIVKKGLAGQVLIEATDVTFQYNRIPVFTNVRFSVQEGDFVALTGPNGAGKSTLLKLILGELAPMTGSVRLFGQEANRFRQWPKIGYMPQNGTAMSMNFPATAFEMVQANLYSKIGLLRFAKKEHKVKVREALRLSGMEGFGSRLFSHMSGGQQQRVLLARMLVNDPAVMILDEPTTGIDAKGIREFFALLTKLNKESKATILLVTHDLFMASRYAVKTLCLEEGSLLQLTDTQIRQELTYRHRHGHASDGHEGR